MSAGRWRFAGPAALALAVAWATWLRVGIVRAGPDPDVDAYAHFFIARQLVARPTDLGLHWVWLPLWHLVDLAAYALHGGLVAVRAWSVLCAAASSVVLALVVRDGVKHTDLSWLARAESVMPWAAGVSLALWPQNLSAGASGEPEAMFQLLVLGAVWAWMRRATGLVALCLSLAVMLRYEAWALLPVFALLGGRENRAWRVARAWAVPALVVGAWVIAHRASTGEWLGFVHQNRAWVADAWGRFGFDRRALPKLEHPWRWYAVTVPFLSVRAWLWWVVPGAVWLVVRGPRALVAVSSAMLAFITAVWVARTNLGLERHFSVVVPAYATAFAAGVVLPASWVGERLSRGRVRLGCAVMAALLAVFTARYAKARTLKRAGLLHGHAREAFVSERNTAAALRTHLGATGVALVDEGTVETLSELPVARVLRTPPERVEVAQLTALAARHGAACVAGAQGAMIHLREVREVYRDDQRSVRCVIGGDGLTVRARD